jgi:hypothetical protein
MGLQPYLKKIYTFIIYFRVWRMEAFYADSYAGEPHVRPRHGAIFFLSKQGRTDGPSNLGHTSLRNLINKSFSFRSLGKTKCQAYVYLSCWRRKALQMDSTSTLFLSQKGPKHVRTRYCVGKVTRGSWVVPFFGNTHEKQCCTHRHTQWHFDHKSQDFIHPVD